MNPTTRIWLTLTLYGTFLCFFSLLESRSSSLQSETICTRLYFWEILWDGSYRSTSSSWFTRTSKPFVKIRQHLIRGLDRSPYRCRCSLHLMQSSKKLRQNETVNEEKRPVAAFFVFWGVVLAYFNTTCIIFFLVPRPHWISAVKSEETGSLGRERLVVGRSDAWERIRKYVNHIKNKRTPAQVICKHSLMQM